MGDIYGAGHREPVMPAMPSSLELIRPATFISSLRPRMAALAEAERNREAQEKKQKRAAQKRGAKPQGWLPYIKAAVSPHRQEQQRADPHALQQQAAKASRSSGQAPDILPLHIQEHLAVLEQCTRNFSDALALVLSAQLSAQHADQAMKDKETGLSARAEEEERRLQADWASRRRLLSIFESMKEVAEVQEAEQRAEEERAARVIQRAWRSTVTTRSELIRAAGGVAQPRTPERGAAHAGRSARLRGWLRGASSTNTGFGRSYNGDRGPNLTRSRNSRASRTTSRRTTLADGCCQLPDPLREVASTATLAALAVAASGSAMTRQSGGYYKSLVATANEANRLKKAQEEGAVCQPPESSRDQQAQVAGDKAAADVLAAGGGEEAAAEARKLAMQRVIDAYRAGATAAAAAAAEVAAAAEAAVVAPASYDPDAAYAAAMAKYFNARAAPPNDLPAENGAGDGSGAGVGGDGSGPGAVRIHTGAGSGGYGADGRRDLMPDIGQGAGGWTDDNEGACGPSSATRAAGGGRVRARRGGTKGMPVTWAENEDGTGGGGAGGGCLKQRLWSASAAEGVAAAGRGPGAQGGEEGQGKGKTKVVKRTKSLRWNVEPAQLGPGPSEGRPASSPGSAAGSCSSRANSRHNSIGEHSNGDVCSLGGRSTAMGSVSVAGGGASRATSNGGCSTGGSTLGTVSVWSVHHSAPADSNSMRQTPSGNSRVDSARLRLSAPEGLRNGEAEAEGAEGCAGLGGSAPNSPRSLRFMRGSKGSSSSKGSKGRGLLHGSGSSSDSDLASSHFSFKMKEKLQALEADQAPHADQDGSCHRSFQGANPSPANSNAIVWAAGASPLGRCSSIATDKDAAGLQRTASDHCDLAAGIAGFGTSLATPFGGLGGAAAAASCASAGVAAKEPASTRGCSMALAAAAAVAAVDAEHRLAVASRADRLGSGGSAVGIHVSAAGQEEPQGTCQELGLGGHPRLRVSTGHEVWGSGEAGRTSPGGSEEGTGKHASSRAATLSADLDGASLAGGASPLASPQECTTPMVAAAVGSSHVQLRRELEAMSSYQIQRTYANEANRASMHDLLLRGQRPLEHSAGGSSGGSSSIRSPSSYAMAHALQAQIDALELRCSQQQQQQQQQADVVMAGGGVAASRQLHASGSGGSNNSAGHQQSLTSDAVLGVDAGQPQLPPHQQQACQPQVPRRGHVRHASDGAAADGGDGEIDAQLKAHAHMYARARGISYEEALEAVIARSRKGSSHATSRINSRVCSRNSSCNSKALQLEGGRAQEADEEGEDEEERQRRLQAEKHAQEAALAAAPPGRGEAADGARGTARKPRASNKRVSFCGGEEIGGEGEEERVSGASSGSNCGAQGAGQPACTPQREQSEPNSLSSAHGPLTADRTPGSRGGRFGSLAASLDSAIKGAAAAAAVQQQQQQQQYGAASSVQQYVPRVAGKLQLGVVAAQQNRHAAKQQHLTHPPPTASPYSKPPTPPLFGGMLHSAPHHPHHPTIVWQDEPPPPTQRGPPPSPYAPPPRSLTHSLPTTPPSALPRHPCPPSSLQVQPSPNPMTPQALSLSAGVREPGTTPSFPADHEVLGEPAPCLPRTPLFGIKRSVPLAALDPVVASLEARKLAAARTRAWAIEHAPTAVEAAGEDDVAASPTSSSTRTTANADAITIETHAPTEPSGPPQPAGNGAATAGTVVAAVADAAGGRCGGGDGPVPSPAGVAGSLQGAGALAGAPGHGSRGHDAQQQPTAAFAPHPPLPRATAAMSPTPSDAAAAPPGARVRGMRAAPAPPPPATVRMPSPALPQPPPPLSSGSKPLAEAALCKPSVTGPSPPAQAPLAAVAPRQVVWMGLEGSELGLQPAEPPAQKCTGGGLQRQLEQQAQQARKAQQHTQRLKQGQVQAQQQQQQEQQQQQARARQQPPQRSSNPVHVASLLPFVDTIPSPPARHSAPVLPGPNPPAPPAYLDLACVGRQHKVQPPPPPQQQQACSPHGYRHLSPMGQRLPSPRCPLQAPLILVPPGGDASAGKGANGSEAVLSPDAADTTTPASLLSGIQGGGGTAWEDSSSTASSSHRVAEVGHLPPIEKGSAFSRYLQTKRAQQKAARA